MIDRINLDKTLSTNKLILCRSKYRKSIFWIYTIFCILIFPYLSITYSLSHLNTFKTDLLGHIIVNIITFCIALYLILGVIQSFKLTKIKGQSRQANIDFIKKQIQLNKWILYKELDDYMIIASKNLYTQINVIFNGNDLIINSIRFDYYGEIDFFMHFKNSEIVNRIKNEFEKQMFYN